MKTYIVPTDFSANAQNALDYALAIAAEVPRKIVLLSVVSVPSSSAGMLMSLRRKMVETAEAEMASLMEKLKGHSTDLQKLSPQIDPVVVEGNTTETILDAAETYGASAIIMGTRGASGLEGQLMGSNTSKVIEKAKIPVLAVPGDCVFQGFGKVVFCTESLDANDPSFSKLRDELAAFPEVNYEILHIRPSRFEGNDQETLIKAENFKEIAGMPNLTVHIRYADDVQEAILNFTKESSAGLLAMVTEQRGIIRKVFDPSLTRKVALRAEQPLLVFHAKR